MNIEELKKFKKENNLYSVEDLSKKFKVSESKLIRIIKIYNLQSKSIEYHNFHFYTEEMKLEMEKLVQTTSRYLNHHSKDKVEGYIKINIVSNYFEPKISCDKVKTLISHYDLSLPIKHKGIWYMRIEDFEFLKNLSDEEIYKKDTTFNLKKEIKNYLKTNDYLTIEGLAEKFNISVNNIKYLIQRGEINLPYKIYKRLHVYDEECQKILKEYLENKNKFIYTKTSMGRYLNCTSTKVKNYLNYLKPTKDECNGEFYTQEFADKLKDLMEKYPILMQNKVYVEGCDICFDSRCEAVFYIYMKEHGYNIIYHPIDFEYVDSKGIKRIYEVDFSVNGRLIELKGNDKFDKNGKPIYKGKSWQEKYDCMIKNNVLMIKSNQFENHGCLKFMWTYFGKNHTFIKHMIEKIQDEVNGVTKEDKYYCQLFKRAMNRGKCRVCIETSEIHFAFEWKEILGVKSLDMNFLIKGNHYRYATNSEQNSYILSKIEELRSKGLDVSWFDKNKEKYLKTENENETIFDL